MSTLTLTKYLVKTGSWVYSEPNYQSLGEVVQGTVRSAPWEMVCIARERAGNLTVGEGGLHKDVIAQMGLVDLLEVIKWAGEDPTVVPALLQELIQTKRYLRMVVPNGVDHYLVVIGATLEWSDGPEDEFGDGGWGYTRRVELSDCVPLQGTPKPGQRRFFVPAGTDSNDRSFDRDRFVWAWVDERVLDGFPVVRGGEFVPPPKDFRSVLEGEFLFDLLTAFEMMLAEPGPAALQLILEELRGTKYYEEIGGTQYFSHCGPYISWEESPTTLMSAPLKYCREYP